jgi:hypothetical protein
VGGAIQLPTLVVPAVDIALPSVPVVTLGVGSGGGGSSSGGFWGGLATWPNFQITGGAGYVIGFVFLVLLFYLGVFLLVEGEILYRRLRNSLRSSRSKSIRPLVRAQLRLGRCSLAPGERMDARGSARVPMPAATVLSSNNNRPR